MRNIHTENGIWKYRVGKQYCILVEPNGRKHNIECEAIKGITPDEWERGGWKKTSDGMLTPSEIKAYILKELTAEVSK